MSKEEIENLARGSYSYEVLSFGYLSGNSGYVKMKSLGNRNIQVWEGLYAVSNVYPNASAYSIAIVEETHTCWYEITGLSLRAYLGYTEATLNDEPVDSLTLYQMIEYQIEEGICI